VDLAFQLGDALLLNGGHTGPLAGVDLGWRTQLGSASRWTPSWLATRTIAPGCPPVC
jgi:hypothetical protein